MVDIHWVSENLVTSATETATDQVRRRAQMDALFTSHAADVYAFALRRTSRSAAQDAVSETFLVAWRRLDSVPEAPKPWLLGVARRVLANQRRAEGRQIALRTRLGSTQPNAWGQDAAQLAEPAAPIGDSAVLAALGALSPAERDAITLVAWDGLSCRGSGDRPRLLSGSVLCPRSPGAPPTDIGARHGIRSIQRTGG